MSEIEKTLSVKISKPYGTERKNISIKSIGDAEANCLQSHYAKGLSDGDTAVMKIKTIGNKNPSGHGQGGTIYSAEGILGALSVANSTAPNITIRAVLTPDREEKRQNGRRMKEDGEPMFTLTAQDRHGIAIKEATKQGYTFANVGDSVNLAQPTSGTRRGRVGKGVSNTLTCSDKMGVVVDDQGRKNKKLELKDTCPTLRAQNHGNEPKVIEGNVRIRKLTPKECWRLQGFPDEYFDKAKAAGVSDSQLYKQAGNAVTVNVARAIGEKLKEIEEESK